MKSCLRKKRSLTWLASRRRMRPYPSATDSLAAVVAFQLGRHVTAELVKHPEQIFQSFSSTDRWFKASAMYSLFKHDQACICFSKRVDAAAKGPSYASSATHPPNGEGHRSRTEELLIDVVHLLDCPPIWGVEGWATIWIETGCVANLAHG